VFGDSYVAVIEFANPVRAMVLNGYGNASQPGSPHRADQLDLFAHKQLRPVWRGRAEIEAHLETREVIAPLPRTASNGQNGTAAASPRG
jgi:acyl-homoserine-lactone acylase